MNGRPPASARPRTRWASPGPPWLQGAGFRDSNGRAATIAQERPTQTVDALIRLLLTDLRRGNHRIAIRHYLMLRRCGARLPHAVRMDCERLISECPHRVLRRISLQVCAWMQMTGQEAPSSG